MMYKPFSKSLRSTFHQQLKKNNVTSHFDTCTHTLKQIWWHGHFKDDTGGINSKSSLLYISYFNLSRIMRISIAEFFLNYFFSYKNTFPHYVQLKKSDTIFVIVPTKNLIRCSYCYFFYYWFWYIFIVTFI